MNKQVLMLTFTIASLASATTSASPQIPATDKEQEANARLEAAASMDTSKFCYIAGKAYSKGAVVDGRTCAEEPGIQTVREGYKTPRQLYWESSWEKR